ncbi:restriction endonuclease subunit S [Acinetobacter pseudolwoffii]|uniref:restriction endonuclease subunit S n=1 Tax=Acinetobacter pseudolwoffii TaxID=2053287 RepID=UPI001CE13D42|nr:restriction endonuclease subunit S [Acinetobacter pseudolwoffii]UBX51822.1 restriction endonuclease subunit S [Acinetobacter pseudolwoffii]
MAAPKLRFKEFDGDWIKSKLGIEAQFFQGEQVSLDDQCSEYAHGLIKFLRIENFTQKSKDFRYIRYTGSQEKILGEQDIAIVRYGATAGFICSGETGVIANNLFKVSVDNKKINQKYLELVLKSEKTFNYFQAEMSGGAMPALNFKIVGNLDITYSSIQEQTKIASFLSNVDEKISQLTQKHQLLSQYKQGMMQKLFSQQLRFKADDGSEFGEWEEKELKEVAEINPKAKKLPANFIYIDLESVEKGQLLLQKNIELQDAPSRAQRLLAKGDVLFQMVRPYQQNNYYFNLSGEYVASTGYAQIRTKLDSKFIYYALHEKTFLDEVMNRCTGTSYPAINSSDLSSIEMFVPCLEEQTKIANFLSAIDQKIEVVAQQIEQVKTWKKGLLQQMFV